MTVYDADSRWGTLVNGRLAGCRELKPGDRITVGETELQLEVEGSPNATTLARPTSNVHGSSGLAGRDGRHRTIAP